MAEDIARQQDKMAEAVMQKAAEQHQAHAYQQWLARTTSRGAPEQSHELER
jgi:hypothetical protein